ncbi:MAG: hypothetical protein ACTSYA_10940 [Candidatus Kariarchaeaceae archaeon]
MVANNAELFIKLLQTSILLVILSLFIYRRLKLKIAGLNWFVTIFSFAVLQSITELFLYFLIDNDQSYEKWGETHFIFYSIALFALFFFTEFLEHMTPRYWLTSIIVLLWSLYIGLFFYDLAFSVEDGAYETHLFSFFFDLFQMTIMGNAFFVFNRVFRKASFKQLKRIALLFNIAFAMLFLVSIIEFGEHFLGYNAPGALLLGIVFLMLAILFLLYPYYVYLTTSDINRLLLLNNNGLLIYSCRLGDKEPFGNFEYLIGGAITALETFLQNIFSSHKKLNSIFLEDKSLTMIEGEALVGIAIVDKSSFILENSMKQFLKEVENAHPILKKEDAPLILDNNMLSDIASTLARCFPFIQSSDIFPIDLTKVELE